MADTVDINISQTVETVDIIVTPNLVTVNINQVTGGGGGDTNLGYTPSATNGIVTSDTGTDATIPLADATNAGLLTPAEKTKIANSVPYSGANSDVNLGEFGVKLANLEFYNTPTNIPTTAGSIYYNDVDGTLDLVLKGGNVKLQIGQESVIRVVNKTVTNITLLESNYQAVRVTGAQGQRLKVDLAQATNDALSAETIGLVTETIANNQEGFITTSGLVRNINTTGSLQEETWLDGDVLYLSPTIAGRITKVKPTAPNHLVIIGYVIYAHATQGTIFVKVDNGYELDELHNVYINNPLNEDFLQYELSTQLWKNKQLTDTLIKSKLGISVLSGSNTGDQDLSGLVVKNNPITGATKTKITYDLNGLVTNGQDASLNDLLDANISSPITDQVLVYDGLGEFRNGFLLTSSISNFNQSTRAQVEAELVAGTNITITPSGTGATRQLTISASGGGSSPQSAYTILANNTNATAAPTEQPFENLTNQTYSGTIVWTGTTAPSSTTQHTYSLSQIGNLVTLTINLAYATAGNAITAVAVELPSTAPTPTLPASVSVAGEVLNYGNGMLAVAETIPTTNAAFCALRIKSTSPNVYEIAVNRASAAYRYAYITIQYFV